MIIARSPLRISFAGGGTDIPQFYEKHSPGVVVSTAIDKYVYVSLNEKFGGGISLRYRIHENKRTASEIDHPLVREILLRYDIHEGIEIVISSDVPARGSGLGASSALACALVTTIEYYKGVDQFDKHLIANIASLIEIEKVGSPIGKQDHYSSALGGLNLIRFNADGVVETESFESKDFIDEIESQSMLFYLDIEHTYKDNGGGKRKDTHFVQSILHDQIEDMEKNVKAYCLQRDNALSLWKNMQYEVPERFIDHVNENWRIKKSLHGQISNPVIDEWIQIAFAAGATAAKVCGAGGGGFLYLMVPPYMQPDVRKALRPLNELKFGFQKKGVEIILDDVERAQV